MTVPEIEQAQADKARRSATVWTWVMRGVITLLCLALAAGALWAIVSLQQQNDTLQARVDAQTNRLDASQKNAQHLYDQLLAIGEKPKGVNPNVAVGPEGPAGPAGQNATAEQVSAAVASYCAGLNFCRGDTGATGATGPVGATGAPGSPGGPGPAGQNATDAQVASAIASYCAAHNDCAGPAGTNGTDGKNGTDGTNGTDGKDGAPGPACPDGYTAQTVWLRVSTDQTTPATKQQAILCLPNP